MKTARTGLITGGGSGIGAAVAKRFASKGLRVALLGRTRRKLEAVASEISHDGGPAPLVIEAHQEDENDVRNAVAEVEKTFGRIDVLFNNAAIYQRGTALETSVEDWDQTLAVNLRGPLLLSRAVIPIQRRQGSGVIINNASTLGFRTVPGTAAYSVSKAALIMLTECLALEEAEHGIRVLAICPGVVDTPIHGSPEAAAPVLEQMAKIHPLGRVGTPEDVASLVEFLADSDSASWMTGSVVTIDGGVSLR